MRVQTWNLPSNSSPSGLFYFCSYLQNPSSGINLVSFCYSLRITSKLLKIVKSCFWRYYSFADVIMTWSFSLLATSSDFSWCRPKWLSLEHLSLVFIYFVPGDPFQKLEIKKVKMPKQTGPSYQQSIAEILLTTGVKDRKGTSAQGKRNTGTSGLDL